MAQANRNHSVDDTLTRLILFAQFSSSTSSSPLVELPRSMLMLLLMESFNHLIIVTRWFSLSLKFITPSLWSTHTHKKILGKSTLDRGVATYWSFHFEFVAFVSSIMYICLYFFFLLIHPPTLSSSGLVSEEWTGWRVDEKWKWHGISIPVDFS